MLDAKETLRRELAAKAIEFADLQERHAEGKVALRAAEEEEAERAADAKIVLRQQRAELSHLATRRSIAKQADTRLRSEFVPPELILAESAAAQTAGQMRLEVKNAEGDVRGLRHSIDLMKQKKAKQGTIEREEKRISEFEIRLSRAQDAVRRCEAAHLDAQSALNAAWDAAREVVRDGAKA